MLTNRQTEMLGKIEFPW